MPPRRVRLQDLNPPQREAVRQTDGPVLILAGAGTGKTRVITMRIAYLVAQGVDPDGILAVTFTNKAANEMRERVGGMLEKKVAKALTVSTFHSLCVRVLRGGIDRLGYKKNFAIYSGSDQLGLLRKIIVRLAGKTEKLEASLAQALISRWKNRGIPLSDDSGDLLHAVADEYQRSLKRLNALDFDDLLGMAVKLLESDAGQRELWQARFSHLMVDEFQDTNRTQLEFVRLLGARHGNVCVVGDDDQSIYGWRGAEIANLLEFERFFENPAVIKLEQNYRSTTPILETANGVIRHNLGRRAKRLWSGQEKGEPVRLIGMPGEKEEAEFVAQEIWEAERGEGRAWEDFAVLFRMNSQSRSLEEALRKLSVPYRVIGGQSFFERREVKDLLGYLSVIANPDDDVNLLRIVNNPARGISDTTVSAATEHSVQAKCSVFAALQDPAFLGLLGTRARESVRAFTNMVELYGDVAAQPQADLGELAKRLLRDTGYVAAMKRTCKTPDEAAMREQNVWEVVESLFQHQREAKGEGNGGLPGFLEKVALDDLRKDEDGEESRRGVSLITLHAAKGLEFPVVYLVGLEEGCLPHKRALEEGSRDEERRLLYVGITRAMERLTISYCFARMRYGEPSPCQPSSFISELDPTHVERVSFDELANQPATEDAAKDFFGMMKARLAGE